MNIVYALIDDKSNPMINQNIYNKSHHITICGRSTVKSTMRFTTFVKRYLIRNSEGRINPETEPVKELEDEEVKDNKQSLKYVITSNWENQESVISNDDMLNVMNDLGNIYWYKHHNTIDIDNITLPSGNTIKYSIIENIDGSRVNMYMSTYNDKITIGTLIYKNRVSYPIIKICGVFILKIDEEYTVEDRPKLYKIKWSDELSDDEKTKIIIKLKEIVEDFKNYENNQNKLKEEQRQKLQDQQHKCLKSYLDGL